MQKRLKFYLVPKRLHIRHFAPELVTAIERDKRVISALGTRDDEHSQAMRKAAQARIDANREILNANLGQS